MLTNTVPTFADVIDARQSLRGVVRTTPVLESETLSDILNCRLYFKCEHLQHTGAFKYRGACNAVATLAPDISELATCSSGNHGAAIAAAAQPLGLRVHVVMSQSAVPAKIAAVERYGGIVHFSADGLSHRHQSLMELVHEGLTPIHSCDDPQITTGQGTAASELLEHCPSLDWIIVPVGGGGLFAGSLLAASQCATRVIGVEPEGAADTWRSLRLGQRVDNHCPATIADGLHALVGEQNFALIQQLGGEVLRVSEAEIVHAMKLIWYHLRQAVEPSAAVVLAAVARYADRFYEQRVGVILSGGNVDRSRFGFFA